MKPFSELLSKYSSTKEQKKHPRFKMLDIFYKRVNTERTSQGMKPFAMSYFGIRTSHLSLEDMDFLLKKCQQASNFSRCFFGLLKPKPKK